MNKLKRQVLFVDDDPMVIRGYKRSADEYSDDWDLFFATSGKAALEILAQEHVDVILTDMRMPQMDGNALLEKVSQEFPGVVRLVLSGNVEDASALHSAHLAHQLIAKPCDMNKLREIVERSCRLRDTLSNRNLVRLVTGIKKIPSLPSLYVRLMKELQSEEPTPKVVGDIIAQDVAMTAKILQLANSSFFGLPNEVTSPQRAVTILGINTIKALVLSIHVFAEYQNDKSPNFSIDALWHHSMIVGNLAKAIAAKAGLERRAQGEAQVAGVLHDIGKLLQLNVPDYYRLVKIVNGKVQLDSEYRLLGTSHAELGAYLLALWGLPQSVVEAVAYHHYPGSLASTKIGIVSALHLANGLYHMESDGEKEGAMEVYLDVEYLKKVQLFQSLSDWRGLVKEMMKNE